MSRRLAHDSSEQTEEGWELAGGEADEQQPARRLTEREAGDNPGLSAGTLEPSDIEEVEEGREAAEEVDEEWKRGEDREDVTRNV